MELKKDNRPSFPFRLLKKIRYKRVILVVLSIFILIVSILYSVYYGAKHKDELRVFYDETPHRINNIPNWIKGQFSNPETIHIDINYNNYMRLSYLREIAISKGVLLRSANDTVPATIRYKDKELKASIRLKGDWASDHLAGEKWSFRIKIKGNETLFNMKEFSIQKPGTRNYIYEWIFHKGLKKEGLIGLRYKFINVRLNGKNLGIYALEEHFDEYLIESNNRRAGPIIKFNEDLIWGMRSEAPYYFSLVDQIITSDIYISSPIDPFNPNKLSKKPELLEEYYEARNLLESFRRGELKTSDVFDIDKYVRLIAFSDLTGAWHYYFFENMRFYYNPITSKLEPIGFDALPGKQMYNLVAYTRHMAFNNELFMKSLLQDREFEEKYIRELERFSDKEYLDNFLEEIDKELQNNLNIIYKDYPSKEFDKEIFYSNQRLIREILNPPEGIYVYYKMSGKDILETYIGNLQQIPVVILNANYKETPLNLISEDSFLEGKILYTPVEYKIFRFKIPENINISSLDTNLGINYKLLGTSRIRTKDVFPWPYLNEDFLEKYPNIRKQNIDLFDFIKIEESSKIILIEPGKWDISRNMIIPQNYTVYCAKGTTLNLLNNSKIISYSPLKFRGTEENPVRIIGGQGLVVLNAKERSLLEYVIFDNLSETHEGRWKLTGSVTFYESPIIINRCQFLDSNSEDALNIVRSEFEIKDSFFENSYSDSIDIDFGKGTISYSSFINCGNDCLDFSGSTININEVYINKAGDKGISVGESTKLDAKDILIKNSRIGVASKDLSFVTIENIEISDCEFGFACYQKKPEFGSSYISASSVNIVNTTYKYIVEEGSNLLIDGKEVEEKVKSSEIMSLSLW